MLDTHDADFLSKIRIALREAKESWVALLKIRVGNLDGCREITELQLEFEASQLSAIFATIILNMRLRLDDEAKPKNKRWTRTNLELKTLNSTLNLQL